MFTSTCSFVQAEEREAAERARAEESERKERELLEAERQQTLLEEARARAASLVPEEPDSNDPEALRLSFQMPNGDRPAHWFLQSHTVRDLWCFVFSQPDAPARFSLTTNFPRRVLPTGRLTFRTVFADLDPSDRDRKRSSARASASGTSAGVSNALSNGIPNGHSDQPEESGLPEECSIALQEFKFTRGDRIFVQDLDA